MSKRSSDDYERGQYDPTKMSKDDWKKLKKEAMFGYTNEDNPFGDPDLDQPFQWTKKNGSKYENPESKQELMLKRLEKAEEIRKAKERRLQNEIEKRDRELLHEEQKRLEEQDKMTDLIKQDEDFNKTQTLTRCRVRIQNSREKPIDFIMKNVLLLPEINKPLNDFDNSVLSNTLPPESRDASQIIDTLSVAEKSELVADIQIFEELPVLESIKGYLENIHDYIDMCLNKNDDDTIQENVQEDIDSLFEGKNYEELKELQETIKGQLEEGEGMDTAYWSSVYVRLNRYMCVSLLKQKNMEYINQRHNCWKDAPIQQNTIQKESHTSVPSIQKPVFPVITLDMAQDDLYSPPPLTENSTTMTYIHIKEKEDLEKRKEYRKKVMAEEIDNIITNILITSKNYMQLDTYGDYDEETLYKSEASKGMDENEAQMKDEYMLPRTLYAWEDKYKPRKPKYFNRVKTGYDWNKYNQKHYDPDNPPPKSIQGYRFNIFYPDLINKNKAPQFYLEPANEEGFCVIRFHAGPPYEDIAFKIKNREWEKGRNRGFKCIFEKGIMHLHFDYKRFTYRR
ncbi:hypothetical protein WA158_006550 [Blastocystis sp. Blastoise]